MMQTTQIPQIVCYMCDHIVWYMKHLNASVKVTCLKRNYIQNKYFYKSYIMISAIRMGGI